MIQTDLPYYSFHFKYN